MAVPVRDHTGEVVAALSVRAMVAIVGRSGMKWFGVYRILLAVLLAVVLF